MSSSKTFPVLAVSMIETGRYNAASVFPAYGVRFIGHQNDNIDTLMRAQAMTLTVSVKNIIE